MNDPGKPVGGGVVDDRRVVPGTDPAHRPGPRVDDRQVHGHEPVALVVGRDQPVQPAHQAGQAAGGVDPVAEDGPHAGHHQGCRDAVAHDVPEDDQHGVWGRPVEHQEVVVVPAGLVAVSAMPGHVEAADPRRVGREESPASGCPSHIAEINGMRGATVPRRLDGG